MKDAKLAEFDNRQKQIEREGRVTRAILLVVLLISAIAFVGSTASIYNRVQEGEVCAD